MARSMAHEPCSGFRSAACAAWRPRIDVRNRKRMRDRNAGVRTRRASARPAGPSQTSIISRTDARGAICVAAVGVDLSMNTPVVTISANAEAIKNILRMVASCVGPISPFGSWTCRGRRKFTPPTRGLERTMKCRAASERFGRRRDRQVLGTRHHFQDGRARRDLRRRRSSVSTGSRMHRSPRSARRLKQ